MLAVADYKRIFSEVVVDLHKRYLLAFDMSLRMLQLEQHEEQDL